MARSVLPFGGEEHRAKNWPSARHRRVLALVVCVALVGHGAGWSAPAPEADIAIAAATAPAVLVEAVSRAAMPSDSAGGRSTLGARRSFSSDGRFLVFASTAANLLAPPSQPIPDDFPGTNAQIYAFDRLTGATVLVSHTALDSERPSNGKAATPVLSADGRFVAYASLATDLVAGQEAAPDTADVFLYDRLTGSTSLVSHANGEPQRESGEICVAQDISADGRYVAYTRQAPELGSRSHVWLFDRQSDTNTLVSHAAGMPAVPAAGSSANAWLSADGAALAFESSGPDLVAGVSDGNHARDVFLYERTSGNVRLVTRRSGTNATPSVGSLLRGLSDDGRRALFTSNASDLVAAPDTNGTTDAFLFDSATGATTRVTSSATHADDAANGAVVSASLSPDGGWVAFTSGATDLIAGLTSNAANPNAFLHEVASDQRRLLSHRWDGPLVAGDSSCLDTPAVNAGATVVLFSCLSTDLVPGQQDQPSTFDVFAYEALAPATRLVSHVAGDVNTAAGDTLQPRMALSSEGSVGALETEIARLTKHFDFNSAPDVFVQELASGLTTLVSRRDPARPSRTVGGVLAPREESPFGPPRRRHRTLSDDGRYVVYLSPADNVVPGQTVGGRGQQVFVFDRLMHVTQLVSHAQGSTTRSANDYCYQPTISGDGRTIAFASNATDLAGSPTAAAPVVNVFLYDVATQRVELASHAYGNPLQAGNAHAYFPALSADGRHVVFLSRASDLVAGASGTPPWRYYNVLVLDRLASTTTLVSHAAGLPTVPANFGSEYADISDDARSIAFASFADDLIADQADTNEDQDVFVYEVGAGTLALVSQIPGAQTRAGNARSHMPVLSADGRYVAFLSAAADLVAGQTYTDKTQNVFVRDRALGQTTLVSHALVGPSTGVDVDWWLATVDMDASGRFITYDSAATNLAFAAAAGEAGIPRVNVFVYDQVSRRNSLISRHGFAPAADSGGGQDPALSRNGRFIAYRESVDGAVVRYDRVLGARALASPRAGAPGTPAHSAPYEETVDACAINADGSVVVLQSAATDLVENDYDGLASVFAARFLASQVP